MPAMRRLLVLVMALVVLAGGGVAAYVLLSGDAPPPPALSQQADATATATATPGSAAVAWTVAAGKETYAGYRVREEFAGIGVKDAVGRTDEVTGTAQVNGETVEAAELEADMTTLVSDEARRDGALRDRGIETDRFPEATFTLTEPVRLSRRATTAAGELTLHGQTREVDVRVSGQQLGDDEIELAGSVPITMADFAIEPPSVAGFVTVEDRGTLEFKLRLVPAA